MFSYIYGKRKPAEAGCGPSTIGSVSAHARNLHSLFVAEYRYSIALVHGADANNFVTGVFGSFFDVHSTSDPLIEALVLGTSVASVDP